MKLPELYISTLRVLAKEQRDIAASMETIADNLQNVLIKEEKKKPVSEDESVGKDNGLHFGKY